jgi:hypothetical protein
MPNSEIQYPSRRAALKAAGVAIALPFLESWKGSQVLAAAKNASTQVAPRMVCIGNMLGFYPETFFPTESGADYALPTVLKPLASFQKEMTVFSGLDHGVKGGHFAIHSFLSGVRNVDAKSMPEGNISIDQRAAEEVRGQTRFSSLTIGSEDGIHGGCQMCWTRSGTRVPPISGPKELFRKLFLSESIEDRKRIEEKLALDASILDTVLGDANRMSRQLSQSDRQKMDEYFQAVRDVERNLQLDKQWANVPKPKTDLKEPNDDDLVADLPEFYDLIAIALQTDSTRIATLEIAGGFNATKLGFKKDWHALSHHGMVEESINALITIDRYQIEQFARFLEKLSQLEIQGTRLLDSTMVLFGSGMGNANSHTNNNLPVLLAGGGFRHGQHLTFDSKDKNRPPLTNLYLSMLQKFGVETERFATSTGTLRGLQST